MRTGDRQMMYKNAYMQKEEVGEAVLVEKLGDQCIKGIRLECWSVHFIGHPEGEFHTRWVRAK